MKTSTGLPDLDILLKELNPGDSIVWRVDDIKDYKFYVEHLCKYHLLKGSKLVYFRFADHEQLIKSDIGVTIVRINILKGFEHFILSIKNTISQLGDGYYYIFDSISEFKNSCYSDRMIGNLFELICPYLHDRKSITYFSFMRYKHSYHTDRHISINSQIQLDVYSYKDIKYIKPFQVEGRYSNSMFKLHKQDGESLVPVNESLNITKVLSSVPWPGLRSASYRLIGTWDRMFLYAEEKLVEYNNNECSKDKINNILKKLLRIVISSEDKVLDIANRYFTLEDILYLWKRMIGTGFIGGKSVGMLLVHAVLKKESPKIYNKLEKHDSFYIGSDTFYTFLVKNKLWWLKQKQKDPEHFLDNNLEAQKSIMEGVFPDYVMRRFEDMLDYYGQSPIIVRSSSLLEDAFGHAFAGKYESVFCPNQGTHKERLKDLLHAIKTVYASTMSKEALLYRKYKDVLQEDEQMALLVQRVSGMPRGKYYYPQLSGVGFSFNPYAWCRDIDPKAGMIRLVYGLGTRAVDRSDNDYTRVIALNAPEKRPESNDNDVKRYSQKKVDLLDLEENDYINSDFESIVDYETHLDLFGTRDFQAERFYRERGINKKTPWTLTFDKLIKRTKFISDMRSILEIVKEKYGSNIDLEFTCNFYTPDEYKICLVQCRPFQVNEHDIMDIHIPDIKDEKILLKAEGAIVGQSSATNIERIIYIDPKGYGQLTENKRFKVARIIGEILKLEKLKTILMGPGRWGTSTPSLGVPVTFAEIRNVYAICEIDSMHEGLVPDLSLGTHFFNEMVETGMVYLGYFNNKENNILKKDILKNSYNLLKDLFPKTDEWLDIIHVIDFPLDGNNIKLVADPIDQIGMLYFE